LQQAAKLDHVGNDSGLDEINSAVIDQALCVESVVLGSCRKCEKGHYGSKSGE